MAKINVDSALYDRANRVAETAGYSSIDEFIAHCIENEIKKNEEADAQVTDQLRGLGYVE